MVKRKPVAVALAATLAGVLVTSCSVTLGGDARPQPKATVTTTVTVTRTATPTPTATSRPPKRVTMPNVVGLDGGTAMNRLQALGLGTFHWQAADDRDGLMMNPDEWKVVRQSPRPGAKISVTTPIDLTGAKRR